jgi:uncharacterized protein (DUF2267 family)
MPMPAEYKNASQDFDAFLMDVRDTCMLQTHHQAYHTLRAVLHVFRAHLTVADALAFASVLPPVTRAIFVEGWEAGGTPAPFLSRGELQREVKAIRRDHNLAPETAIADVARALRRSSIDTSNFDRVLRQLPQGAAEFWAVAE